MGLLQILMISVVFGFLRSTSGEIFTALSHTQRILNIELELSDALEIYIREQELRLKKLKDFSGHVRKIVQHAQNDGPEFLGHPINSYLMIQRFVSEWPTVQDLVESESSTEGSLLEIFAKFKERIPDANDLQGAVAAIRRLQEVYALQPVDFTEGRFGSTTAHNTGYMLSPADTFRIGRACYIEDEFQTTQGWMLETLRLMELGVHKETVYPDRKDVLDHLSFSEYKINDFENSVAHSEELLKLDPTNERVRSNVIYFTRELDRIKEHGIKHEKMKELTAYEKYRWMSSKVPQDTFMYFNWYAERDIYKRLCRGEKLPVAPHNQKRLKCWYSKADPLCIIKRCAMERVFTNPDIIILKRIITDSEVEEVRQISEPLLNRATVHNPISGKLETAQYRISKNCWLTGENGNVIKRIENRIAAMTRLDLKSAEGFQVQNYGLAGHYDPHFDFSRNLTNSTLGALGTGNRLATVLVYMTQVAAGGATVFPYIGVRVLPQKGDAVFWHNLLRSGEGDYRTRHAGCPVLSGIKWVANKWIHEHGNEFKRPCTLHQDD